MAASYRRRHGGREDRRVEFGRDEQQNVDRNYAVINLKRRAANPRGANRRTGGRSRGGVYRSPVRRSVRCTGGWGIFVFSGFQPVVPPCELSLGEDNVYTRRMAALCMFAVTEENLNQPRFTQPRESPLFVGTTTNFRHSSTPGSFADTRPVVLSHSRSATTCRSSRPLTPFFSKMFGFH